MTDCRGAFPSASAGGGPRRHLAARPRERAGVSAARQRDGERAAAAEAEGRGEGLRPAAEDRDGIRDAETGSGEGGEGREGWKRG